jgi:hypothetical protein
MIYKVYSVSALKSSSLKRRIIRTYVRLLDEISLVICKSQFKKEKKNTTQKNYIHFEPPLSGLVLNMKLNSIQSYRNLRILHDVFLTS